MRRLAPLLSCMLAVPAALLTAQDTTQVDTVLDVNKPTSMNAKDWRPPHDSNWAKSQCYPFYWQQSEDYKQLTECLNRYGLRPPSESTLLSRPHWRRNPDGSWEESSPRKSDDANTGIVVYYKVTEQNDVYWRIAWRLPLKNTSDSPARFTAIIKFLDADGFEVADDRAYNLSLQPKEEREFTGATLIRLPAAATVTRARVEFEP